MINKEMMLCLIRNLVFQQLKSCMTPHLQPPCGKTKAQNNHSTHQSPIDLPNSHLLNPAASLVAQHIPQNQTSLEQQTPQHILFSTKNQHQLPPHTQNITKKRERRTLSKTLISQLNEAFSLYKNQPSNQHFYLRSLAHFLKIGYSTVLRKYCEFKASSHVDQGKRLNSYPKEYNKSKLARCLIFRTINEKTLGNAREICRFILERYGLYYDITLINKQLRKMGMNKRKDKAYHVQQGNREYLCDQCLLQCLIKMGSKIIYFSQYIQKFHYDQEVTVMLLASKFGAKIKIIRRNQTEKGIRSLAQQFWHENQTNLSQIWYLVMRKQDIYGNGPTFSQQKDNVGNVFPMDPKLILLGPACMSISPAYHLLNEILTKMHQSQLSLSDLQLILPEWLETQQDSASKFISQAERYLWNQDHSCPI